MIKGTILIYSAPALVLFDSGSMHTFIAKAFVNGIGMGLDDLGYDLVVTTPIKANLTSRVCMKGYRCCDPMACLVD